MYAGPSLWAGHRGPGPPSHNACAPPLEAQISKKEKNMYICYIIIYIINAPFTCNFTTSGGELYLIIHRFIFDNSPLPSKIDLGPSLWAGHRGPGPPPHNACAPPLEAQISKKEKNMYICYIIIYIINAPFTCMGPSQLPAVNYI